MAYENDCNIVPHLEATLELCRQFCTRAGVAFQGVVRCEDFVSAAVSRLQDDLFATTEDTFTHVILNPPYKKINGETHTRRILNSAGLETSNLYAAFVWLSALLTRPGGEIVAITPRSFCNGPYFRRFRKALLGLIDLRHVHLFESRKKAFADDSVLQENVIFHAIRNGPGKGTVQISVSEGLDFGNSQVRAVPFQEVVAPSDPDAFIHLADGDDSRRVTQCMTAVRRDLGRTWAWRSPRDAWLTSAPANSSGKNPEPESAPVVYPCHFENGFVRWPLERRKEAQCHSLVRPDTRSLGP